MSLIDSSARLIARYRAMPAPIAMQRLVYWGVIVLAGLVIGLTALYGNLIPARISAGLDRVFSERAWARPLASIDGQRVVLRGEIETGYSLEREIERIRRIPGVRDVTVDLETNPMPPASAQLRRNDDGSLVLSGTMAGNDADQLSLAVSRAFPGSRLQDRLVIDDRVGRPIWLDGLGDALRALRTLEQYTLFGWQDAMMLNGVAADAETRDTVRYGFAATLPDNLIIDQQIRLAQSPNSPRLSLVVGWNGAALNGRVGSEKQADLLAAALRQVASDRIAELVGEDVTAADDSAPLLIRVTSDPDIAKSPLSFAVAGMLPFLSPVHDLRIATSGEGLAIWGRLDNSETLGEIEQFLDTLPDNLLLENYLTVDLADRKPELSLFRDNQRLIISGRLPAQGIKRELLQSLRETADISEIEEFISIEPNVAFSPWIERWLNLMPALPKSVFGLTVAADSVLVSGQVADRSEKQFVGDALGSMFPGMRYVDWITVAEQ